MSSLATSDLMTMLTRNDQLPPLDHLDLMKIFQLMLTGEKEEESPQLRIKEVVEAVGHSPLLEQWKPMP